MTDIKIHRKNIKSVGIRVLGKDRSPYNIPAGHIIEFTVKKSASLGDDKIIIKKTVTGDGGNYYVFRFDASDTDLFPGIYCYDVKNTTLSETLGNVGKFIILEAVND